MPTDVPQVTVPPALHRSSSNALLAQEFGDVPKCLPPSELPSSRSSPDVDVAGLVDLELLSSHSLSLLSKSFLDSENRAGKGYVNAFLREPSLKRALPFSETVDVQFLGRRVDREDDAAIRTLNTGEPVSIPAVNAM
jgi:hypothetical protein